MTALHHDTHDCSGGWHLLVFIRQLRAARLFWLLRKGTGSAHRAQARDARRAQSRAPAAQHVPKGRISHCISLAGQDTQRLSITSALKSSPQSLTGAAGPPLLTGAESLPGAEQQVPQSHRRGHFGVERQDTFILSDQTS